jgi:hypothetical protein
MTISTPDDDQEEDRRKFLATCGRFTAATPPRITILVNLTEHWCDCRRRQQRNNSNNQH